MTHQIALRISQLILLLAGLALFALVVSGSVKAIASETPVMLSPNKLVIQEDIVTDIPTAALASQPVEGALSPIQANMASSFVIKRVLKIDEPFVHGYYKWDDEGIPDGPIVITVDLKAESLSVFKGGYEIGATVIKFGDALKPTPTGVFSITQKDADHVSNIYDAPMPYMMRLTNDGIAIHGADVKWGYGTRGCVGVPTEFARLLFEQVKLGDRVIITNGKTLDIGEQIVAG
ncbi:MAG: L,D-transpeptidase family protein [Parasphingorhabdus sp.]|uniref:L,D-transpeptidase family protein n=1 Tax=Parasphingorhabdus sp. TaxID=2709688 RepID=UPI003002A264